MENAMLDAFVVAATLAGSFVGAFLIQKTALEGLLRVMGTDPHPRQ
jgi:hypothetical protein